MNTLMFLWIFFVIKCTLSTFVGCGQWRSRIVDALYEHTLRQAQSDTYFGSLTCHAELVEASFMKILFDKLRVTCFFRFSFLSCWACRSIIYEHTLRLAQSDIMIKIFLSGWACRSPFSIVNISIEKPFLCGGRDFWSIGYFGKLHLVLWMY